MLAFIARRLLALIPLLFVVTVVCFLLVQMLPGDPALAVMGSDSFDPVRYAQVRKDLGLDRPLEVRYVDWVVRALKGDLGRSARTNLPIGKALSDRLGVTITLSVGSLLFAVLVGLIVGIITGTRPNTWLDRGVTAFSTLTHSIPSFWQGILMMILFSQTLKWLPAFGYRSVSKYGFLTMSRYMVLPWLTLGTGLMVQIARQVRSEIIEVLSQDFIRTARAKGLGTQAVIWRHALRNAMIPVATVIGLQVGDLLGGAVVTETVFSLPGIGSAAVSSVIDRDFLVLQAIVLLSAVGTVLASLATDLSYGLLDPRIRYE